MSSRLLLACLSCLLIVRPSRLPAEPSRESKWFGPEPSLISFSIGAAEILDPRREFCWSVQYSPAFRLFHMGPWLLFGTGRHDEFYAAVGIHSNIRLGGKWLLTPSFGAGYYHAGSGLDLGLDMQFRSSIEMARRFANGQRLGLSFTHLSNGSVGDENPGTEILSVSWSIPIDTLFRKTDQNPNDSH